MAKCGSIFTPSGASDASAPSANGPKPALTKVAWSSEGRKLAVGDARGHLHILGVAEEVRRCRNVLYARDARISCCECRMWDVGMCS